MKTTSIRPRIRTRTGSLAESAPFAAEVAAANYPNARDDAASLSLPDGDRNACRVQFNRDTGEVIRDNCTGHVFDPLKRRTLCNVEKRAPHISGELADCGEISGKALDEWLEVGARYACQTCVRLYGRAMAGANPELSRHQPT